MSGLQKILRNSGWLIGEQFIRLLIGLALGIWVARHLGPVDYGLLSYAIAYTSIFGVVAALGLNRILVRELVSAKGQPEHVAGLMSTAFAMRLLAAALLYLLAVSAAWVIENEQLVLVALIAGGFVFGASDLVDLYFQAKLQSRSAAKARMMAFICSSAVRVGLLVLAAPVTAFAALTLLEFSLASFFLQRAYTRNGSRFRWSQISSVHAKSLLGESAPEILAALGGILFMRLDQVMLQHLASPAAVGTFAVAARLSELWYFVPVAIVASAFPGIVAVREINRDHYLHRIELLTAALVLMAYSVVLCTVFLVVPLVPLLFGAAYAAAAPVLVVQVWCGVFLVLAQTSGAWIMAERRARLNLYRSLLGLVVNLLANLALIPQYGATGAAVGTLISFVAAYFLYDFFVPSMRPMALIKMRALLVWPAVQRWRAQSRGNSGLGV